MAKHHVQKILSAAGGEEEFLRKINMSERTLEHALYVGYFSGLWFGPIEKLCVEIGAACPREAFKFKSSSKKIGDASQGFQEDKRDSAEKLAAE